MRSGYLLGKVPGTALVEMLALVSFVARQGQLRDCEADCCGFRPRGWWRSCGLDPDMESKIWQRLSSPYRSVVNVQTMQISAPDPREYGILSQAISVAHSRANTDMPRAELVDMATTINPAGLMLDQLNNELIAKLEHLRQLEACHHTWTWPAGGRP